MRDPDDEKAVGEQALELADEAIGLGAAKRYAEALQRWERASAFTDRHLADRDVDRRIKSGLEAALFAAGKYRESIAVSETAALLPEDRAAVAIADLGPILSPAFVARVRRALSPGGLRADRRRHLSAVRCTRSRSDPYGIGPHAGMSARPVAAPWRANPAAISIPTVE